MSDFKERLLTEQQQLNERLGKLNDFLSTDKVKEIEPKQAELLNRQSAVMGEYSQILQQRIDLLN